MALDIKMNREAMNYSPSEMAARFLWGGGRILFRFSPRPFFGWRVFLLRAFGAKIGKNVHIYNSTDIFMPWHLEVGDWSSLGEGVFVYNLGKIKIGKKTTISQRTHLCAGTHDYTDPGFPLKKLPLEIGNQVWICADCFIGPSVTIGDGAITGARAVVNKDVEPWIIVAGNPAKFIKRRILKSD